MSANVQLSNGASKMAKKGEVATTSKKAVAMMDVNLFEQDAGLGNENVGQEDLALPFLKILSGLSDELDNVDGAVPGMVYNTVSGELFSGKDGIKVVPCHYNRRFLQWAPRGSGMKAPKAIFAPGDIMPEIKRDKDTNKDMLTDSSGDYLEDTHQHFVLLVKEDKTFEAALISMKATQLKKSKKWNSMISSTVIEGKNGLFTPPRFSHLYHLTTLKESNDKGNWHGWEISKVGVLEDAGLYQAAKEFSRSIQADEVVVKHENESAVQTEASPF
jgi:hypothetical protein